MIQLPLNNVLVSDHFLRVRVTVAGVPCSAILDTGAGINIASERFLSANNITFKRKEPELRIGTLGSEVITPIGQAHITIGMGNTTTNIVAQVVESFRFGDLLLGNGYMEKAAVVIDMRNKRVSVGQPSTYFSVFRTESIADSPSQTVATICPMSILENASKRTVDHYQTTTSHSHAQMKGRNDTGMPKTRDRIFSRSSHAHREQVDFSHNRHSGHARDGQESADSHSHHQTHMRDIGSFIAEKHMSRMSRRGSREDDNNNEKRLLADAGSNWEKAVTRIQNDHIDFMRRFYERMRTSKRVKEQHHEKRPKDQKKETQDVTTKTRRKEDQESRSGKKKIEYLFALRAQEIPKEMLLDKKKVEHVLFVPDEWEADGLEEEPEHLKDPTINSCLTREQYEEIANMVNDFAAIFSAGENDIGLAKVKPVKLDTGRAEPINKKPYPTPIHLLKELQRLIDLLLKADIIEPSVSPWNFPSVLVKKPKSEKYRFTINFKPLNDVLKKNAMAPPDIELIMDRLGGMEFFTILDARQGFFHIPLDEESKEKTAFRGPFGHYQFKRLPQGLATAPALFQQVMNDTLGELQMECAVAYMDDVIIFSRTFAEHRDHIHAVFSRLKEMGLKISLDKSQFAQHEVPFLGRMIGRNGIQPDPKKLEAIRNFPRPTNKKEIERFIGMASYQRRFIKDFAEITAPYREFWKDQSRGWNDKLERAHQTLLEKLTTAPVLQFPDLKKRFYLFCDASLEGLGVLLKQKDDKGHFRLVGCVSRKLNTSEKNYAPTYLECLAIFYGMSQFQRLLVGKEFSVVTDHHSLCYLQKMIKPHGMLPRWILAMMNFDFVIEWTSGRSHKEADALSRAPGTDSEGKIMHDSVIDSRIMCRMPDAVPCNNREELEKLRANGWTRREKIAENIAIPDSELASTISRLESERERLDQRIRELQQIHDSKPVASVLLIPEQDEDGKVDCIDDLATEQDQDPSLKGFKDFLTDNVIPDTVKNRSAWRKKMSNYVVDGTILCRKQYNRKIGRETHLPVIPHHLWSRVLSAFHDAKGSGHMSTKRMLDKMSDHVWWTGMFKHVQNWCASCEICARNNTSRIMKPGELIPLPVTCIPGEVLQIDTMDKLTRTKSGNVAIYVITDRATRHVWAFPARANNHVYAMKSLQHVMWLLGRPKVVLSDGGVEYRNQWFDGLLRDLQIQHDTSSPYHPQTNGQTERMNHTIISVMKKYVAKRYKDWDVHLDQAIFAINCSKNEHTQLSPYTLLFGLLPPPPIIITEQEVSSKYDWHSLQVMQEVRATAMDCLQRAQQEYKRKYDEKREPFDLKEGDYVLVKNHHFEEGISKKLQECFSGPYRVKQLLGTHGVEIKREGRAQNCISKYGLKKFTPRATDLKVIEEESETESDDDQDRESEGDAEDTYCESTDENRESPESNREQSSSQVPNERDHRTHDQGGESLFGEHDYRVGSDPIIIRRSSRQRFPPKRLITEI